MTATPQEIRASIALEIQSLESTANLLAGKIANLVDELGDIDGADGLATILDAQGQSASAIKNTLRALKTSPLIVA